MKKKFSVKWISSKQTRKQRKYRFNAPLHIRQKFMNANLSEDLRKKYEIKSLQVRKNDKVKIMRGKFVGKQGKVSSTNLKRTRISIEGIQKQKKDGTKVNIWFHPSKVQILELVEDKFRLNKKQQENASQKK